MAIKVTVNVSAEVRPICLCRIITKASHRRRKLQLSKHGAACVVYFVVTCLICDGVSPTSVCQCRIHTDTKAHTGRSIGALK